MNNPTPPRPTIPFAMTFRESPGDLTCVLCNRDGADYEAENRAISGTRIWWGAHRRCLESHEHRTAPKGRLETDDLLRRVREAGK